MPPKLSVWLRIHLIPYIRLLGFVSQSNGSGCYGIRQAQRHRPQSGPLGLIPSRPIRVAVYSTNSRKALCGPKLRLAPRPR